MGGNDCAGPAGLPLAVVAGVVLKVGAGVDPNPPLVLLPNAGAGVDPNPPELAPNEGAGVDPNPPELIPLPNPPPPLKLLVDPEPKPPD